MIIPLIDSSFEYDSNGGQIIKIDEIDVEASQICISGGGWADITSFLTDTNGKFWSIAPLEREFSGWYYHKRVEEDKSFP